MGKNDKKRKQPEPEPSTPAAGFSLFSSSKPDTELGGVFSASAAFALPEVKRTKTEKKGKKGKKEEVVEVVETVEVESPKAAEVETAEVEDEDVAQSESAESPEVDAEAEVDADSDAESTISLTHEALKNPSKSQQKKKTKTPIYVPEGESKEDRDRRTLFIGNVGLDVAKNKSAQNQLRAHLLTFAPSAKVESLRCRSVAFATPTTAIDEKDEKEEKKRAKREQERAAQWRAAQAGGSTTGAPAQGNRRGDDEVVDKSKSFLDSKGKRKVAFIKGDFHSDAATCNVYVVFAYSHPDRPTNVAPIMDPFEAAEKVLAADGSVFQGRTIRADRLRLPSAIALASATNALSKRDAWLPTGTDPKMSLFVGGLDYAAKEEDVRAFFEALVVGERGAPPDGHWVTGVRIIRDKDTQLGKGFGYVHFADRESVDEMIALPSTKLKFAKKPLRLQPCKTLPTYARVHGKPEKETGKDKEGKGKGKRAAAGPIPRGNPALGEKIKDLSKDERKAVKSADADRQARRLAKKKNKVAAAHRETGAVKLTATKAEKKRTDKKVKAKKGRVRSAHALTKMKGSRQ